MRYILASASPRRRELLTQAGLSFDVMPSGAEEKMEGSDPAQIVRGLAMQKAADIYAKAKDETDGDLTVIGADTVVSYRGEILGKPADGEEAMDMLSLLADRTHQVYTGVCLLVRKDSKETAHSFHACTQVTFYPISRQELRDYIATGDPLDKAGAYGIQGPFAIHVKGIEGDYNNVVGLPIARLWQELKQLGLK